MAENKTNKKKSRQTERSPEKMEDDARKGGSTASRNEKKKKAAKSDRTAMTAEIDTHVMERLRNATYWTPGEKLYRIVERAVAKELDRMERERGNPFPERAEDLTGGRSVE